MMSDIHIRRIRKVLFQDYDGLIDLADVEDRPDSEVESHFLTRSQAALALCHIADISPVDAASAIVDGYEDNGIDAIYFDEENQVLYAAQSKWDSTGKKTPSLGSIEKFISGFKDLLTAKFERFNAKVNARRDSIVSALESPDVLLSLVIVYTGTQKLSHHAERKLNDLLEEYNDPTEILSYRVFGQGEVYNAISRGIEGDPINLNVTLQEWGKITEPYRAYYGRVSVEEVASWFSQYNSRLFVRNLRKFKGDTEVNRSIKSTLVSEPDKFWYFNNGITALCDRISKKPIGGTNRDVGQFYCEGVSVVNGAQTVGNIAMAVQQGFRKAKQAYVLVRFISLEDCPPDFATEVTTATNTQNRIESRDFASLDPTQEQLRQELSLDLNKVYVYKSGENPPLPEDGCTIEDATIALACAYPNIQLAADAKSAVGKLWEDIKRPPYTLIFNDELSAARMWHSVQILRAVETALEHEKVTSDSETIRRFVAIHGNRFILHRVFQILPVHEFDDLDLDLEPIMKRAREEAIRILDETTRVVQEHYPDSYLNSFFKSGRKCSTLEEKLPKQPTQTRTPYLDASQKITQPDLFSGEEYK
jgi:hypothetical protein